MKNIFENGLASPEAAITGIGIISPLGCSGQSVLEGLRSCTDAISGASKIDTSKFASHICAQVEGFDYASNMSAQELETFTDPFLRMAINAARMALKDGKADFSNVKKTAIVFATCNAGLNSGELEYVKKYLDASVRFDRSLLFQSEFYAAAKVLAKSLEAGCECFVINTACSGSTAALGLAEALVESGKYDAVLAGGADAMALSNFAGFSAIKVVSPQKIAPFSLPVGMNIGEGAAFWLVENMDCAIARNAKIYGKIIGHATSADAHHPTQPDPRGDGAYRTMRAALDDSGITLEQIGCINAHGSGTAANDRAESKAIEKFCIGASIPVTSTKSYMGHCMGATGILEATCQLLSMNDNFIPPTLHYTQPRSGCEINVVTSPKDVVYDSFLSANYAFAGNNAAIVVAKKDFKTKSKIRKSKRIFITGLGAVSALGTELDEQIRALACGACGIEKISRFQSERMAAMVKLPPLRTLDRRVDFSGMNNISAFATLAAKRALDCAEMRISRLNSETTGLTVAVSNGSSDMEHMEGVFKNFECRGDIACFSNMTANSTAGWVSKALELKGANITLTGGLNSGLQTIGYVRDILQQGRAKASLALAADEIFSGQLCAYDNAGYLWHLPEESDFKLRSQSDFKTVLGEGAAAVLLEGEDDAAARNAKIFGEVLAYCGTMDIDSFLSPNLGCDGLNRAITNALGQCGLHEGDIDLIIWAPRGDRQDDKLLKLINERFAKTPAVTSVFNTGYVETASALLGLVYVLKSLDGGIPLWRQKTGDERIDNAPLPENPKRILCIASSHCANNHALIVGRD